MTVPRLAPDELPDAVQGNIVPGFNKDHQAFVLVSFADQRAGRAWLRAIAGEISTCRQVGAFKAAYKAVHPEGADGDRQVLAARWTNVGLAWRGLQQLLGPAVVAAFPPAFKTNRVPLVPRDPADDQVHAVLLLAADRQADLDDDLRRHRGYLDRTGARELKTFIGQAGQGPMRGREHFGFKDGVSQPRVAGLEPAEPGRAAPLPAGEFILGAPGAYGEAPLQGPEWTRYGSYAVFLQLEQHVGLFHDTVCSAARRLGVSADQLAAAIVGRCQNGHDLRPGQPPPPTSHIGRAHPRAIGQAEANRHRILRRGISYGDALPEGAADPGGRGLLFLAYQADLQRQFEQVWARWLNSPDMPTPGTGSDGLVGQAPPGRPQRPATVAPRWPNPALAHLQLPQFVTPRYGGYFFAPSIHGLDYLAGEEPAAWQGGRPR